MNTQKHRVADFFDNDSSEYLEQKYASNADSFMALRRGRVNEMLMKHVVPAFNEEFRFLDCGCGPGILLDMVAKHRISYWGVDISDEMLRLARRQPAQFTSALIGKHLLRSDVESLPFRSGTFDAAASLGVIEYLEGDERLMAEMAPLRISIRTTC
jgi:ubiquinone/menaquinone biosynthesis C-methylase UbiE